VAFVGHIVYIRIFDQNGNKVIDDSAHQLTAAGGPLLTELIQLSKSVLSTFPMKPEDQHQLVEELAYHLKLNDDVGPPFYSYSLSLVSVPTLGDMADEGRNVVIIGLVGDALHIRIFDPRGWKLLDLGEEQMLSPGPDEKDRREKLSFLKNLLRPAKTAQQDRMREIQKRIRTVQEETRIREIQDRITRVQEYIEAIYGRIAEERGQVIISTAELLAGYRLPPGYSKELAQLRDTGVATFTVPPPAKDSTKADNPFAEYCNVRLKRVRAWVDGISDGFVDIYLKHKGDELVRAPDKSLVPFVHTYTEGRFKYEAGKLTWDSTGDYVANPADALKHGIDGDFPLVRIAEDKDFAYLKNIGPFTDWEIQVLDGDKSKINAIYLEFHGIAQNPDRKRPG
jgi:hypothetical protein